MDERETGLKRRSVYLLRSSIELVQSRSLVEVRRIELEWCLALRLLELC